MRHGVVLAFAATLAVSGIVHGQTGSASEETAIRRVIQQHDQTRSAGDWRAASNLFTNEGSTLTSAGEWRRGRAQLEKLGAATGTAAYKGGKYTSTVESVRMLAPTVALVDTRFEIASIAGGSRRGHTTYVLVKEGDQWRIAASRSMVPTPVGATKD